MSGVRGTVAADLLRRMPVAELSLLTGVLCTLRLSLLMADSLPELTRLRDSLYEQRLDSTPAHHVPVLG